MGSQPSVPSSTSSQELNDKLGKLALARVQVLDELEGDDGVVDEKQLAAKMSRRSEGVPIGLTQAWHEGVLKDPKNQWVPSSPSSHLFLA